MKKLSIRSLLIVVLALVLVFSLVACGDKDKGGNNGGNDTPTTPTDTTANVKNYFNTLWEKSTGIGGEKIGEKDDLKVSLGLTVALDFADGNGSVKDSIDLGILLDVVLDRSSGKDSSTNTAIKAKFYDPTSGENWFSAYYFFNDVDNLYIDYAGQHVQIPFSYLNDTYLPAVAEQAGRRLEEKTQSTYDTVLSGLNAKHSAYLAQAGGETSLNAQKVLVYVMANTLKLLHPFMPFIT